MGKKKINLRFFQLCPLDEQLKDNHDEKDKIKKIFDTLGDNPRGISRYDSEFTYRFWGQIKKEQGYILGGLLSTQKNNIPPAYDEKTSRLTPLDLPDHAGLGYESCFLYDTSNRILMIESSENAVPVNGICGLINHNSMTQVQAVLVVNPKELEKVLKMGFIRRFTMKIAQIEDGSMFKDKSVGQVINSAKGTNGSELTYSLNAGSKKMSTLNVDQIKVWVRELLGIKNKEDVTQIVISGKEDEDSKIEEVDLIKQGLKDSYTINRERLVGGMDTNSRHQKMMEIFKKHKPSLKLYEINKM